MGRRKQDEQIDWVPIYKEYRINQKSLRQIAVEFKVQPSAISRKAKAEGWIQDKKKEVDDLSRAQLLVSNREKATLKATPTKEDIEIAATTRTNIVLGHRIGLKRLCVVKDKMLDQIESVVDNFSDLAALIADMRNPDESGQDRANDKLKRCMDRSTVIDDLKKLAEIDEKIRKGEREAFGIDDGQTSDNPVDALLRKIYKERIGG